MIARCAQCQHIFNTDRYGRQFCPQCGAELLLNPPPGAPADATPGATPGGAAQPPAGEPGAVPPRTQTGPGGTFEPPPPPPPGSPAYGAGGGGFGGPPPGPSGRVPWEDRATLGWFKAFVDTCKAVFTDPVEFFGRMGVDSAEGAVSFYWLTAAVSQLVSGLNQALVAMMGGGGMLKQMQQNGGDNPFADLGPAAMAGMYVGLGLVSALAAPLGLYLAAGMFHLGLMLVGGANKGFDATLKSVAYASPPSLLGAIPLCGYVLAVPGGIWVMVLNVIGLWKTHQTDAWRAVVAVLLPVFLLCCLCCGAVASVAAVAGMAAKGGLPH